jgi:hypothetical protein
LPKREENPIPSGTIAVFHSCPGGQWERFGRGYIIGFIGKASWYLNIKLILESFFFKDNGKPPTHDISFPLLPYTKIYEPCKTN